MTKIRDRALLDEATQCVVQVAQPEKIFLFGSTVQVQIGPHRDLDLMAFGARGGNLNLKGDTRRNQRGVGAAVDLIGALPNDRESNRDSYGSVIQDFLSEERVVYGTD